jgi:hypothetical protein
LSYDAIAREVGLSVGSVFGACRAQEPDAAEQTLDAALPPELAAELGGLSVEHSWGRIVETISSVRAAALAAKAKGDVGVELACARALVALEGRLDALRPPPEPPDPNDRPDMREAADAGRKKLGEYGERARLGKSYGPARVGPSSG